MLTLIGGDRPVSTHTQVTQELQYAMVLEWGVESNLILKYQCMYVYM